jgi:hypothetical protein
MLLCALGYDADAEGFKGATWASAVLSKAAKIALVGSDANLTVDMGAPLNRDNTAQMMLNALKSDMVEYESTSTITVNGVTINNNSKASAVTKKGAQYANIVDDFANDAYTVQLGEEMFKDLTKTAAATTDEFGRKTSVWQFEGKDVTAAHEEATLTYKDTVKGGELYTALGKIAVENTAGYTFTYKVDGVDGNANELKKIASGNLDDFGQVGDVIEVYKDTSAKTIDIIQINYYPAEINEVWAAKVDANGDETQSAFVQVKAEGLNAAAAELTNGTTSYKNTVESAAFTSADKGTYAVITVGRNEQNQQVIMSIAKAELASGLFSSFVAKESVTIAGTKYNTAPYVTLGELKLNENATVVLDPNGNVLGIKGVESSDYAYVMRAAEVGGVDKSVEAVLVFTDGTRKTVTIAPNSEAIAQAAQGKKALYAYNVDSNGKYELTTTTATIAYDTTATYANNTVAVGSAKANANTVFVVETYDSAANAAVYTTYTGIANVPNVTATAYDNWSADYKGGKAGYNFVSLTKDGDTYASFVFVFGATTQGTSKNVTALYLTGNDPIGNDGNGNYATVKAIVDGAETTVKMTVAAYDKAAAAANEGLLITNNMQVDSNGYITAATPMASASTIGKDLMVKTGFAKDATTDVYTGTYADGVITFEDGEAYSVLASLPVYAYNVTTRTFTITTIGSYLPAEEIGAIEVAMDTTADPDAPAAFYIVEGSAGAFAKA